MKKLLFILTIFLSINCLQVHAKVNVKALQAKRAIQDKKDQELWLGLTPTEEEQITIDQEEIESLKQQQAVNQMLNVAIIGITIFLIRYCYLHEWRT